MAAGLNDKDVGPLFELMLQKPNICSLRFQDKLLVWFKHPGWVPPGVTPPPRSPKARIEIPLFTRR